MIRPLRQAHRNAWLAMAFVLPATLWVSLAARGPAPERTVFASHEQVTILDRAVELRLPETWVYPDVLVYAVAGGERHLVGQWSGRPVERFPLPDRVTAVELFSLGHQRTIRRFEKATR